MCRGSTHFSFRTLGIGSLGIFFDQLWTFQLRMWSPAWAVDSGWKTSLMPAASAAR